MPQQKSAKRPLRANVGPKWQGLGLAPTSMILGILAAGQNVKKIRECQYIRIACGLAIPES